MRRLVVFAALGLALSPAVFAQSFVYEQIDVPRARLTRPSGVNAAGQIVGLYRDAQNVGHGFRRNPDGTYRTIDYPGALFTQASTISARGEIAGRWTDAAGINHGFVRTTLGEFVPMDPPSPCVPTTQVTVVHGINDIGDLVGRCFNAAGKELGWLRRHDGSFQVFDEPDRPTSDAQMVTNRDEVVGDYSDESFLVHGYTWTEAGGYVTVDFPGSETGLRDMNERGDITGVYVAPDRIHGFVLSDGVFETIDYPGSVDSSLTLVINNSGLMAGGFIDANGAEHGFIARADRP